MYGKQPQTKRPTDELAQGRTDLGTNMVSSQRLCVSLRQLNVLPRREIFQI